MRTGLTYGLVISYKDCIFIIFQDDHRDMEVCKRRQQFQIQVSGIFPLFWTFFDRNLADLSRHLAPVSSGDFVSGPQKKVSL